MSILTAAEWRVLQGAVTSPSRNYQPDAGDMPAADTLLERGLLGQDPAFPACLVPTSEGHRAYGDMLGEIEDRLRRAEDARLQAQMNARSEATGDPS
jgi:hypothetical protein